MALKDPKVALFGVMILCLLLGTGFTNFFPTYDVRWHAHSYADFAMQDHQNSRILIHGDTTPRRVRSSA